MERNNTQFEVENMWRSIYAKKETPQSFEETIDEHNKPVLNAQHILNNGNVGGPNGGSSNSQLPTMNRSSSVSNHLKKLLMNTTSQF